MVLTVMSIVVPLIVGGVIAYAANFFDLQDYISREQRITLPEFAFGAFVIVIVAVIVTQLVGPNLSRQSAINGYREFYNGSVTQALVLTDTCNRDGSCAYHYDCDPYEVKVVDQAATSTTPEVSHWETRYHECPYVTRELDYVLTDNLGRTIAIGDNYFESRPHEWRNGHGIPGGVPREPPNRWLQARRDLANGISEPVTGGFKYANYILASDSTLFKRYGGNVEQLKKAGLLPKHTADLGKDMWYDYGMRADKLQVVGGLHVTDLPSWEDRLMRFNAALGSAPNPVTGKGFQGDMHVVLVPANKVSNPDEYLNSLKAYWTSLGKWSISKNGIILVIGASNDGRTVAWSRATTGMPFGNGTMIQALNTRLYGLNLDPNTLFGNVPATARQVGDKHKVDYNLSLSGAVGNIVLQKYPFIRACMQCKSKGDTGVGYVNLKDLVPISTWGKIVMFIIVFFLSLVLWGVMLWTDLFGSIFGNTFASSKQSSNPFGY